MKKYKIIKLLPILILAIALNFAFINSNNGEVKVVTTTNFQKVDSLVNELLNQKNSSNILVVLDIDNTILTSSTDLGGDIWYQWQRGKLNVKPTDEQIVDCLFEDSIGLLYELGTTELTDSILPTLINNWQEKEIPVFALTSRSPKYRAATERELSRREIDFTKTALRPDGENLPNYRYYLKNEMSYMQGIMMTSGMNKGEMLQHILQKTGQNFESIIFVDDSEKNVYNLEQQFKNSGIDMTIFHYTKVIEDRKIDNDGEILTEEQAERMHMDWKKLNATLKAIFPDRYTEGRCLN
ncbi:MAG: DUF2608 domain-containing protein [Urechidicola sp.]|nr:DUF2608 domain-containing protein [Urechidicola sp.]